MQEYYDKTELPKNSEKFNEFNEVNEVNEFKEFNEFNEFKEFKEQTLGQKALDGLKKLGEFILMLPGKGAVLLFTMLHSVSLALLGSHKMDLDLDRGKTGWLNRIGLLGAVSYYLIERPLEFMVAFTEKYKKEISIAFWVAVGLAVAVATSGGVMAAFFPAAFAELVNFSFLGLSIAAVAETAVAQVALFAGLAFAAADVLALALVPVAKGLIVASSVVADWVRVGVDKLTALCSSESNLSPQNVDETLGNERNLDIDQFLNIEEMTPQTRGNTFFTRENTENIENTKNTVGNSPSMF